jgi:hypothetical protein
MANFGVSLVYRKLKLTNNILVIVLASTMMIEMFGIGISLAYC